MQQGLSLLRPAHSPILAVTPSPEVFRQLRAEHPEDEEPAQYASDVVPPAGTHGTHGTHGTPHEAPWSMAIPLIVLGALSVVGGWINVPHAIAELPVFGWLPHSEWLHEWLHPVTAGAEAIFAERGIALSEVSPVGGGEGMWAVISFAIAVLVIVAGAAWLVRRERRPALESASPTGLRRVLYRKWYVDEIYDRLIVRPLAALSRFFWKGIDSIFIDGSIKAQLSHPDMRMPIRFALGRPERLAGSYRPLDFAELGSLTFEAPDTDVHELLATFRGSGVQRPAAHGAMRHDVALYQHLFNLAVAPTAPERSGMQSCDRRCVPPGARWRGY